MAPSAATAATAAMATRVAAGVADVELALLAAARSSRADHDADAVRLFSMQPPDPSSLPTPSLLLGKLGKARTPPQPPPLERRMDTDGTWYTEAEFVEYFGGRAEWEAAAGRTSAAPAAPPPPLPAAPAPPQSGKQPKQPKPTAAIPPPLGLNKQPARGKRGAEPAERRPSVFIPREERLSGHDSQGDKGRPAIVPKVVLSSSTEQWLQRRASLDDSQAFKRRRTPELASPWGGGVCCGAAV